MAKTVEAVAILVATCCLNACTSILTAPAPQLIVEDRPLEGVIIVRNPSSSEISIYYNYGESFGDLQMFFVRFRDRNGQPVSIDGALNGWFTPKIYSSDIYAPGTVPRREFRIPANGTIGFERRLDDIAYWVRWGDPPVEGPCEVQIRLSGYLDNDDNRPVEAMTDWNTGPCPR